MSLQTGRNDPCGCGSGKKYKDCCGTPQLEVASVRVKDVKDVELTPGLADAFTASLDASYLEYFAAACSGMSTKEAETQIAAIPEGKRYLTRVLDSLDSALADLDTETATLDLPHMQNRKPEAIKRGLKALRMKFLAEPTRGIKARSGESSLTPLAGDCLVFVFAQRPECPRPPGERSAQGCGGKLLVDCHHSFFRPIHHFCQRDCAVIECS